MRFAAANSSAIGLLRVLLAATVVVPLALFGAISLLSYRAAVADAERDLKRTSEVAAENAEKIFISQTQLCDRVNDLARDLEPEAIAASEWHLHETLRDMVAGLPHVASVMIASGSGTPLVSAGTFPVPRDVDLHGRDYFDAIMSGAREPFISNLQVGAVHREQFFGLARPWTGPDGSRKGVIDIAISPAFFENFYQMLVSEGVGSAIGKVVTLVRTNGHILVRYPALTASPPASAEPGRFLAAIAAFPTSGVYTSASIVDRDAPKRLFAYNNVRGYPLYVVAGRSWSAILAEWRATMLGHLLFGIPVSLMLFAVTRTALARALREEQALQRANLEIKRREVAEEALLRAQRLEAVGQLTGGVAHDFNNLLTVIAGNAALIDKRADDAAASRRFAANIQLAAQRGAEITQQLLAFAGRHTVRPETIDLNVRLRAFKPLLDRAAGESVQIGLELQASLRPVCIDPGQFEAAVLNLVGNARDAMPDGGRITITTRASGPAVIVTVADTGTGMDRDTVARAFEPFFTTKGVGKGTGLGLSQVYGFARQAGGGVQIVSSTGSGTAVEIMLPAADGVVGAMGSETSAPAGRFDPQGRVVLVVEDEPNVLETALETLGDLGYVTMAAAGAGAALEHLRRTERVDVLFTDMVMPGGMNGLQLSTEARRLRPDIKVLLTSGYTGLSGVADLPGDIPLLAKPYDRKQLSARLEAVLEG